MNDIGAESRVLAWIEGKQLTVQVDYPEETTGILFKLDSGRNETISYFSERSFRAGEKQAVLIKQDYDGEIWFPVVDVKITPSMYAKAVFENESCDSRRAEFSVNGWLWPEKMKITQEAVIPAAHLLEWENGIYVTDKRAQLKEFSLFMEVPQPLTITRRNTKRIALLSEDWTGRVSAYYKKSGRYVEIGDVLIGGGKENHMPVRQVSGCDGLDRQRVLESLEGNLNYILNSQIESDSHPMNGGFHLFYDLDAKTYRLPAWLWGWGPAIAALLKSSHIAEMAEMFGKERLLAAAVRAGEATLSGQVFQEDEEQNGLSTARWDPNLNMEYGYRQRICTASDSGFLCGWAWISLYEDTKDERFLEASVRLAKSTAFMVEKYKIPPQDYMPEKSAFTAHTLDESGFGVKAFDALYRVTKELRYQEIGRNYIDYHIEKFEREDGLWERSYHRDTDSLETSIYMTRGLGWAMEGLLSAWTLTGDVMYREKAEKMADYLLDCQNEDGSWNFMLNRSIEEAGFDDKGTPLWSVLLYRLYDACKEPVYLAAARKALVWCMRNQIVEGERECIGGLAGANPQSAVVYRPWFLHSCLYTSGFFALALMEELNVQERQEKPYGL